MPPRIYLLRHGEAQHKFVDISRRPSCDLHRASQCRTDGPLDSRSLPHTSEPTREFNGRLLTCRLSQKGLLQALGVPSTYSTFFSSLDHTTTVILTSPFRRCLETTIAAFASVLPPVAPNPCQLIIRPELQECGKEPCDTGGDLEDTKQLFDQPFLDWSHCTAGWNAKQGFYEATEEKQQARARWVRRYLRGMTAEKVVVVAHNGFLRRITKNPPVMVRRPIPRS